MQTGSSCSRCENFGSSGLQHFSFEATETCLKFLRTRFATLTSLTKPFRKPRAIRNGLIRTLALKHRHGMRCISYYCHSCPTLLRTQGHRVTIIKSCRPDLLCRSVCDKLLHRIKTSNSPIKGVLFQNFATLTSQNSCCLLSEPTETELPHRETNISLHPERHGKQAVLSIIHIEPAPVNKRMPCSTQTKNNRCADVS